MRPAYQLIVSYSKTKIGYRITRTFGKTINIVECDAHGWLTLVREDMTVPRLRRYPVFDSWDEVDNGLVVPETVVDWYKQVCIEDLHSFLAELISDFEDLREEIRGIEVRSQD